LNQPVWIVVGQRLQQDPADDGEYCGIAADCESQRKNGGGGEGGILAHRPKRMAGVLPDCFQEGSVSHWAIS
jgi:hypothetical protein